MYVMVARTHTQHIRRVYCLTKVDEKRVREKKIQSIRRKLKGLQNEKRLSYPCLSPTIRPLSQDKLSIKSEKSQAPQFLHMGRIAFNSVSNYL